MLAQSEPLSDPLLDVLKRPANLVQRMGRVVRAHGTSIHVSGLTAGIGQRCAVSLNDGSELLADVVGLHEGKLILFPLGELDGVAGDSVVRVLDQSRTIGFSAWMTGCVLDAHGHLLDRSRNLRFSQVQSLDAPAPAPLSRTPINTVFETGVRVIDSLLTVGRGQRMGIFAMAGAGKSTLLSMLACHAQADIIVIALVGERGREVREFIEHSIGAESMKRSVVIVATSDRPAMERVMAAQSATAIAEGFRATGRHVLLLMDSITRYARALREVGLSAGELPVRRGYPPSVFAALPKLFERAGNDDSGSITAFYTVLAEDEDNSDPVAEETRSILDGHIVLSRELGEAGHYPAIDPLASVSRLFATLASPEHIQAARNLRQLIAKFREIEFLVQIGEYKSGTDVIADQAIKLQPLIRQFLQQSADESFDFVSTCAGLQEMLQPEPAAEPTATQAQTVSVP